MKELVPQDGNTINDLIDPEAFESAKNSLIESSREGKSLTEFVSMDDKILREFLGAEENDSGLLVKYKNYPLLVKKDKKPRALLDEVKSQLPLIREEYAKLNEDYLDLCGFSSNEVALINRIPDFFDSYVDMRQNYYEAIVHQSTKIANQNGVNPIDFVKVRANRNEILRNIFETRSELEAFLGSELFTATTVLGLATKARDSLADQYRENIKPSLFRRIVFASIMNAKKEGRTAMKQMKQLPETNIIALYIQDLTRFGDLRANQVFGTLLQKHRVEYIQQQ
jgi:hypothetical protein